MTNWRVAYCSSGSELETKGRLTKQGFSAFCPYEVVTRTRKVWRSQERRKETVKIPFFPNYIFVNSERDGDERDRCDLVSETRGVLLLIKRLDERGDPSPVRVPDRIIDRLREISDDDGLMSEKDLTKVSYHFKGRPGDIFRFKRETGLDGLLGRIESTDRLDDTGFIKAWVNLLGGDRLVDISYNAVGKIDRKAA